jgi:hypothetical protein
MKRGEYGSEGSNSKINDDFFRLFCEAICHKITGVSNLVISSHLIHEKKKFGISSFNGFVTYHLPNIATSVELKVLKFFWYLITGPLMETEFRQDIIARWNLTRAFYPSMDVIKTKLGLSRNPIKIGKSIFLAQELKLAGGLHIYKELRLLQKEMSSLYFKGDLEAIVRLSNHAKLLRRLYSSTQLSTIYLTRVDAVKELSTGRKRRSQKFETINPQTILDYLHDTHGDTIYTAPLLEEDNELVRIEMTRTKCTFMFSEQHVQILDETKNVIPEKVTRSKKKRVTKSKDQPSWSLSIQI